MMLVSRPEQRIMQPGGSPLLETNAMPTMILRRLCLSTASITSETLLLRPIICHLHLLMYNSSS